MADPLTPHKRRSPCCADEAARYLAGRATVPAPVTPDLRALSEAATAGPWVPEPGNMRSVLYRMADAEYDGGHSPDAAFVRAAVNYVRAALSDRDAEPVSPDPLRLDPEDPESVERLRRAIRDSTDPDIDEWHALAIARAFAAPDPTEETK